MPVIARLARPALAYTHKRAVLERAEQAAARAQARLTAAAAALAEAEATVTELHAETTSSAQPPETHQALDNLDDPEAKTVELQWAHAQWKTP